ncbi:HAD superfamily hydrolase (TIGR01509 family) [Catenuloplanes nepalensis]|uniref:HAD superfamily hydrolase (TIGR01509 family) n=1 Tax=Catenuloplanes nepalensis TaxID=587533 RepID=A0ABT9MY60_9ACTN|nr:HAD family hydrolase [Catenuloplanes nepalensis]MDP9796379.1 HAD superfamily hydrolase (TIGR01509 family) [Catenuloplanes nepalensis]
MGERRGVLFDVDGTLVDTTYLHTVSWWSALREHGHDVPMAVIHRAVGMGSDRMPGHLLGDDRDPGQDDGLRAAHKAFYAGNRDRLRPLPGARELLFTCAERGLAVVLASSADEEELDALRTALDADDAITAATSSADAGEGGSKPAPDILEAALAQSGVDPARAVFVGDSVWDMAAGGRLDLPCIGLACGGTCKSELAGAGAVAVYDDPASLLALLDESPLGLLR